MSTNESQASTSGASAASATAVAHAAANAHASIATLPKYWPTRPELWFVQAEAIFEDRIPPVTTDKAKTNLVLQALPCEVLKKVEHVVKRGRPSWWTVPCTKSSTSGLLRAKPTKPLRGSYRANQTWSIGGSEAYGVLPPHAEPVRRGQ